MSSLTLILRSLIYHRAMHFAVALGVVAATAVLTGALTVGDSMRESLRDMALGHLGKIDGALVADHFFRAKLADESSSAPLILLRGSLEKAESSPPLRANQIQLIGCDERFWAMGKTPADQSPVERAPGRQEVILTTPVAAQLNVKAGDTVLVRLPRPDMIPAESALGRKRDTVRIVRMKLIQVIDTDGLGGFALQPSQQRPRNAFVDLSELQEDLEQAGKANAMVRVDGHNSKSTTNFRPILADFGLRVLPTSRGYIDISSDRLLLNAALEESLRAELLSKGAKEIQPALVYLANTIACGKKEVPYSTVAALDFADKPPLGPFIDSDGKTLPPLKENEIAINDWTAERLQAHVGDAIRIDYFEPISFTGEAHQVSKEFRLAGIVPLKGAAADAQLTPTVKGLSDRQSIGDWDPPFPFDNRRIHKDDEKYWKDHRATPKAFVALAAGQKLWGNRFGNATSLRVDPGDKLTASNIEHFSLDPQPLGFVFQPIRRQILSASAGTTPFGVLFLSFSMFVIAAALILVALLFRLGVERRSEQIGILLALGFKPGQVLKLLAIEGLVVVMAGSIGGTAAGVGYAALMLLGLRTWWLAAVVTPFLRLHVTLESLSIGLVSGILMAWLSIWLAVRRMVRIAPQRLLAGEANGPVPITLRRDVLTRFWRVILPGRSVPSDITAERDDYVSARSRLFWFDPLLLISAALPAIGLYFWPLTEDVQVGAFFSAASWSLAALLWFAYRRLKRGATGRAVAVGSSNLLRLALRNSARNPGRSSLSIALVASATFLIVSVSVFHIEPEGEILSKRGGSGGFALVCQSDQPIYVDLNSPQGRRSLELSPEDEAVLAKTSIFGFRVKPGDDASCLNLYAPRQPRILGVSAKFRYNCRDRFADAAGGESNVFIKLRHQTNDLGFADPPGAEYPTEPCPVILDRATANYSLNLWQGVGERFTTVDSRGVKLELEVVGLLDNSIFQGDMLIGEANLLQYDPLITGYRFFLVDCPPQSTAATRQTLERVLEDYGFVAQPSAERLAGFLSVQNTYLATFQSLGGLGLLLGTFGLAVVQLRNQLERRSELALLRAIGFRNGQMLLMVVLESVFLLLCGMAVGLLSAGIAVWPQLHFHPGSLPWASLAAIMATVAAVGTLTSMLAALWLGRMPLVAALHEER